MKLHYKNLDAVRFIAASAVVISHIELLKKENGLHSIFGLNSPVFLFSKLGVDLFFVLSGFLITSLLFVEKSKYGSISIKNFYIKRMLRIWPLYFFISFLAFFIFPHIPLLHYNTRDGQEHLWQSISLFILFMPNIQSFIYGSVMYCGQTWSIGIEEQYYLIWPWVMKRVKSMKMLEIIIILSIAFFVTLKLAMMFALHFTHANVIVTTHNFLKHFPIHTILFGCYFSVLNQKPRIKNILTRKTVQISLYVILALLLLSKSTFSHFFWEIYALVFGGILLNLVNPTSIVNLEFKPISYLGKISYGIYMYHLVVIAFVIRGITTTSWLIYVLSLGLTVVVSAFSYELAEKRILNFKDKVTARKVPAAQME